MPCTPSCDRHAFWAHTGAQEYPARFVDIAAKRPHYDLALIEPRLLIQPYRLGWAQTKAGARFRVLLGGPRIVHRNGGKRKTGSFFTQTSKMSCFSFSLPAGPEKLGGTCPASLPGAIPADVRQKPADAKGFICGECYAGKNRYLYGSIQKAQTLRFAWVERALAEGVFVEEMFRALRATFDVVQRTRRSSAFYGGRKLRTDVAQGALELVEIDPHFFRIHDSGDFYRLDYYTAWAEVCRLASAIKFWAPTRMWVFPDWRTHMTQAAGIPKNLALRPSALWFDARPPKIAGFAAGTGAGAAPNAWDCPAWGTGSCGTANGPNGSAPCRTCWAGKTPVVYHKH